MWYDTAKRGLLHEIAVFCSARPAAGPDGLRRAGGRRDPARHRAGRKTQTAETAVLYEDADGREVSPRRAALTEWRWSVADDTIAEVDPSGIVTGLRGGSTTLTLQSADGKISASCPVQVSSPLRGIALDDYTLYFDDELVTWITADGTRESDYAYASRVGAVCHLLPEDTTDHPAATYHIADERIARFDGSWLVPVNYGTTTLTADCGGFTAQCTVTVVRPE